MKKFIALALVTLGITVSARAQWIVYDPANTVQSVINTAQEIARVAHPPSGVAGRALASSPGACIVLIAVFREGSKHCTRGVCALRS